MSLAHNIQDGHRTQDVRMPPNVTFETLLLTTTTLEGLAKSGFYKPSPIQLHGIPMGKCGFDLLLEAKSGTGKTAVFSIIALEMLDLSSGLQVVILAPTREIASQICDVLKLLGSSYEGLQIEVVMGGLPIHEDILKFKNKKAHVVVGSPGRLKHLIQDQHIDVSAVRLLVLDEADKLMEKSFQADINYIFSLLPAQKQVIMSSATYPDTTKAFINQYVQNAQHICPDSNSILLGIEQKATLVKSSSNIVTQTKNRLDELLKILSSHPFKQCLIFCNYQARVTELHKMLKKAKWPAEQLYGKQEQTDRLDALKTLQEYKCRILISTDLAARGIDASNVDLVINFEPPYDWQTYLHRIGRAGRFGSYGKAVTILSIGREETKFKEMLKSIKNATNLTNLWNDEKFHGDYDSVSSESESVNTNESHLTDKELASVEEKVTEIIGQSNGPKPTALESFSDLQTSFAARKTGTSDNEPAENIATEVKISEKSKEPKPSMLESFSDIQTSFATRKTITGDHKPFERTTKETKICNKHNVATLLSDHTLQSVVKFVSEMIKSSKEITPSSIAPFEALECDLQNFQEVLKERGNNIEIEREISITNIENADHGTEEKNNILPKDNEKHNGVVSYYKTNPTNHKNPTKSSEYTGFTQAKTNNKEHKDRNQDEYDYEYYGNVSEALRQAGLPTAFGETKFSTWNQNNRHNNLKSNVHANFSQVERHQRLSTSETYSKDYKQCHSKAKKKHHKFQIDTTSMSHDEGSDEPYDNGYYSQPQSYRKQHWDDREKIQTSSDYENDNTEDFSDYSSQNYLKWYKQLKLVTKQIELAVYISELSKL